MDKWFNGIVWYCIAFNSLVRYRMVLPRIVWHFMVLQGILLYFMVLTYIDTIEVRVTLVLGRRKKVGFRLIYSGTTRL